MGKPSRNREIREGDGPTVDRHVIQEDIRKLAYQLYCECGYEHGHDLEHWLAAEKKVLDRFTKKRGQPLR